MALYKRTRFWWGSYHDPRTGEFVRKSTKCTDRNAAAAVLREWERAASDPNYSAAHSTPLRVAICTTDGCSCAQFVEQLRDAQ